MPPKSQKHKKGIMSNFFSSTGIAELVEWLGLTAGGGALGWIGAKRKREAEGVEATIKVWERTVEHLEEQLEDLRKENVELRARNQRPPHPRTRPARQAA